MENNKNIEWETNAHAFEYSTEMKRIRKSLRKRYAMVVCTCLILIAIVAFGIIQYGIPALEKQYWDPNSSTCQDGASDLELSIKAYTELFCPGYEAFMVDSVRTGFATHTVTAMFSSWSNFDSKTNLSQKNAILCKNNLSFSAGFWENYHTNAFNIIAEKLLQKVERDTVSILKKYPDYVQVLAAIHFPEDLDMKEISKFCRNAEYDSRGNARKASVIWVSIRNRTTSDPWRPACGFDPHRQLSQNDQSTVYPYLNHFTSEDTIDQHFTSMLRLLQDQLDQGTGFQPPDSGSTNCYADILNYVEENGVMANGAYIIASPEILLELYNSGQIDGITLCDAWLIH